jgi:hypothetical protein
MYKYCSLKLTGLHSTSNTCKATNPFMAVVLEVQQSLNEFHQASLQASRRGQIRLAPLLTYADKCCNISTCSTCGSKVRTPQIETRQGTRQAHVWCMSSDISKAAMMQRNLTHSKLLHYASKYTILHHMCYKAPRNRKLAFTYKICLSTCT